MTVFFVSPCISRPIVTDVARGPRGPCPPKFAANVIILCFDRRYPKQNTVPHLKSNILARQSLCLASSLPRVERLANQNKFEAATRVLWTPGLANQSDFD